MEAPIFIKLHRALHGGTNKIVIINPLYIAAVTTQTMHNSTLTYVKLSCGDYIEVEESPDEVRRAILTAHSVI